MHFILKFLLLTSKYYPQQSSFKKLK
jgi:hypothetical protein